MSRKGWIAWCCCLAVLVAGCVWVVWGKIDPPPAVVEDAVIENLSRQIKELEEQAKKKVVVIREQVKEEVFALPPDGVADGLNNELASFRRSQIRPQGICDD